ncbi:oxidoreductase, putative [Ricinus communis]|uniref:Oxidoreductase, putative n=2 Tax=Ricinus communis TaxID=3988 RepID=B9T7L2_RICCO|nr:oxidoreductase, putative [Ricinus communis]
MASKKESVQELSNNGEEPSAKFFHNGNDAGISDVSVPLIEIPVVDIGLLTSPSTKKGELQKLQLALTSWGCFQFFMKSEQINEILLKAMAMSLDIGENCFLEQYGEQPLVTARFNYYPPCPRPNQILGVKPHADASAITILLQDKEVEGLQFLKGNEWFRVPIIPQALLVNVGDQVEIMSNEMFKSPVHRVVTNSERERITMAMFFIPGSDKEIKPADALIDETRPRLYKKVKDYVSLYFQYYQLGRRPIEAAMM